MQVRTFKWIFPLHIWLITEHFRLELSNIVVNLSLLDRSSLAAAVCRTGIYHIWDALKFLVEKRISRAILSGHVLILRYGSEWTFIWSNHWQRAMSCMREITSYYAWADAWQYEWQFLAAIHRFCRNRRATHDLLHLRAAYLVYEQLRCRSLRKSTFLRVNNILTVTS